MPDISKCPGTDCPLKENCYRFTAPDSFHQSYFTTPPLNEDGSCDYYWKIKPQENDRNSIQKTT